MAPLGSSNGAWSCRSGCSLLGAIGPARQCLSRALEPADHWHRHEGTIRGLHRRARRGRPSDHRLSHHRPGRHGQTGAGRRRRHGEKGPAADRAVQSRAAAAGRRPSSSPSSRPASNISTICSTSSIRSNKLKNDLARDKILLDGNAIAPSTYKQEQEEYDYNVKLRAATIASRDVEQRVRATQLSQEEPPSQTDIANASVEALTIRAPMDGAA